MTTLGELKQQWLNDPCWDIEETEGFEAHYAELLAFRLKTERDWKISRINFLLGDAQKLINQAMEIAKALAEPATCVCGTPLDAAGNCPREAELDASLRTDDGTEKLPLIFPDEVFMPDDYVPMDHVDFDIDSWW